jgi:hypothetical protein
MTTRILLLLAIVAGLLRGAAPASAGQGTEQLIGAYNFLLEASARPTMVHGDFATFRTG